VNEGSRKTAIVIGAVAAAAGIAVASGLLIRRKRSSSPIDTAALRNVGEVLNECYRKIKDIQNHLSEISTTSLQKSISQEPAS
jgi:hypothetical protein